MGRLAEERSAQQRERGQLVQARHDPVSLGKSLTGKPGLSLVRHKFGRIWWQLRCRTHALPIRDGRVVVLMRKE